MTAMINPRVMRMAMALKTMSEPILEARMAETGIPHTWTMTPRPKTTATIPKTLLMMRIY